jgi:hypothetical protein
LAVVTGRRDEKETARNVGPRALLVGGSKPRRTARRGDRVDPDGKEIVFDRVRDNSNIEIIDVHKDIR